ncbi:MAG: hypothetical protein PHZ19_12070 [Candidatus Thermoplasmatota archaeon]|nr:hypothetical protein [Candidatus Thermoplasmatota archaeon]
MAVDTPTLIAFFGIILGALIYTLFKWQEAEQKAGEEVRFDWKYLLSMATDVIIWMMIVLWVFSSFEIPEGSLLQIFIASFFFAAMTMPVVNVPVDWMRKWLKNKGLAESDKSG